MMTRTCSMIWRSILHSEFRVETACGCKAGLATVHLLGPFAIVISHLRMSGLNGVEFLDRVRELEPHSVRILLTRSEISSVPEQQ